MPGSGCARLSRPAGRRDWLQYAHKAPGSSTVQAGITLGEYAYDAQSRRIRKDTYEGGVLDNVEHFYCIGDTLVETRNGSNQVIQQHVWHSLAPGMYIDSLAEVSNNTNPGVDDSCDQRLFTLQDQQFNILALTDDQGDIVERYEYTLYGERTVMNASFATLGKSAYNLNNGFQGLYHDAESGLLYNRARMYDPASGRFTQRDPLGYPDGMNTYAAYHVLYGGVDPWGLEGEYHYSQNINGQQDPASYARREMELFAKSDAWSDMSKRDLFSIPDHGPKYPGIDDYSSVYPPPLTEEEKDYWSFREGANQFLLDTQCPGYGNAAAAASLWGSDSPEIQRMAEDYAFNALMDVGAGAVSWGATRTPGFRPKAPLRPSDFADECPNSNKLTFPDTADGMTDMLGTPPKKVGMTPDGTPRTTWEPNSNTRIRHESHPDGLQSGDPGYNPRHHGEHYHVETKPDGLSWNQAKRRGQVQKEKPEGYTPGDGTGFVSGEDLPGS